MKSQIKKNKARQELTAPILIPDVVDYHGDTYSEEEVLKACRNFEDNCKKANLQHMHQLDNDQARWIESYVTIGETVIKSADQSENVNIPEGTWMGTMAVNDSIWKATLEGKFTGFSIQCKAHKEEILKSKMGDTGKKAVTKLSDFDFSGEDHAVALVDEAANFTEILVFKAHNSKVSTGDETNPGDPGKTNKEETMTLEEEVRKLKSDKEALEVDAKKAADEKSAEVAKAKEASDKLASDNADELEKSKTEIADLKKFKEEADEKAAEAAKSEMVIKAKNLKADNAEDFADILVKCKGALEEDQYETLEKQLCKLANITDNADLLKAIGDGTIPEETGKTDAEVAYDTIAKSVRAADSDLESFEVRTKALKQLQAESPELAKEFLGN